MGCRIPIRFPADALPRLPHTVPLGLRWVKPMGFLTSWKKANPKATPMGWRLGKLTRCWMH